MSGNYSGNSNFTGVQNSNSNLNVNSVSAYSIGAVSVGTTALNALNVPGVGVNLIAQLPLSFYSSPFAVGTITTPLLLVDLDQNYVPLPTGSNTFLSGLQVVLIGFGPGGGGSFTNPTNLNLGTCSLAKTNISFTGLYANQVPLINGAVGIVDVAGLATTTIAGSISLLGGVSIVGGTASITAPAIGGWDLLHAVSGAVSPNNYLCAFFTALATAVATNAVGQFYLYISYFNGVPTALTVF